MNKLNRILAVTAIAFSAAANAAAQGALTADQIVEKSKNVNNAKSTQMQVVMTILDKKGGVSVLEVEQYGVDQDGLTKSVIAFKKPANVANTRFLVVENQGRDEDRWIFLPELGKVRRIASSEGGGSFMGTDFSYDDISTGARETSRDSHTLLREENKGGSDCYVIESAAKAAGDSQYSKSRRWIAKDTWLTVRAEMFDKEGKPLKVLELGKFEKKQGYWTPMSTKISNVQAGTSTTMELKAAIYDKPIPPGVFTEKYLKTGRP